MTDTTHWMKQLERWWKINPMKKDKRFVTLGTEALEDRVTPVVISGAIFEDWTRDSSFDVNRDPTLDNQFVYIDSNNNGQFDKSITQTFASTNTVPFTKFNGDPLIINNANGNGNQFFTSIRDTIAVNIPFVSIQDINVKINYSNTNIDLKDYDILLVTPLLGHTYRGGGFVNLLNPLNFNDPTLEKITVPLWVNSDPNINVSSQNMQELRNTIFDDDAININTITDAQAPFTSRYSPDYKYAFGKNTKYPYNSQGFPDFFTYDTLTSLIGSPASGQWGLEIFYKNTNVTSTFFGSAGILVDWSLEITYGEINSYSSAYQIQQKNALFPQGVASPFNLPNYSPDYSYYMDIGNGGGTAPIRVNSPGASYMNTTPTVVGISNPTQNLTFNFGFIRTAPAIYGQVFQDGNNNGKVDYITSTDSSLSNFNNTATNAQFLDFDYDYGAKVPGPQGWGDAGLGGVRVYVDTNNNGVFDITSNNNLKRTSASPVAITDATTTTKTTTSVIDVSGMNSNNLDWRVTNIRVGVNITQQRNADLILTLISPAGNRIVLASKTGASSSNWGTGSSSDAIFSSLGGVAIPAVGPYSSPSITTNALGQVTNDAAMYIAADKNFTLADLATSRYLNNGGFVNSIAGVDGIPANGQWTLEVQDLLPGGGVGVLNKWWLDFDVVSAEPNQITEANNYKAATYTDPANITDTYASRRFNNANAITEDGVTRSTVPGLYRIATTGFGANVAPVAPSTLYKVRVVSPANMGVAAATQFLDTPGLTVTNPLFPSNYNTAPTLYNPVYLTGGPSVTHDFLVGSSVSAAPILPSIRPGPAAPVAQNLVVNPIMDASGPTRLNDLYIANPVTDINGTTTANRDTISSIRLIFNGFVEIQAGAFELTRVLGGGLVTLKSSASPSENQYPNITAGNTTAQILVGVTRRGNMTNNTGVPLGDVTVVDLTFTGPTSLVYRDPLTGIRSLTDGTWQLKVDGQFIKNNIGQRMAGVFQSSTAVGQPDLIRRLAGDFNGDGTVTVIDDPWSVLNPDLPNVVGTPTQYTDGVGLPVFIDVTFDQPVSIAGFGGFDLYRIMGTTVSFVTNTGVAATGSSTQPASAPPNNTDGTIPTIPNTPLPVRPPNTVRIWFANAAINGVTIVAHTPNAAFPAGGTAGPVVVRGALNSGTWRLVVDPSLIRSTTGNLPMAAPYIFDFIVP